MGSTTESRDTLSSSNEVLPPDRGKGPRGHQRERERERERERDSFFSFLTYLPLSTGLDIDAIEISTATTNYVEKETTTRQEGYVHDTRAGGGGSSTLRENHAQTKIQSQQLRIELMWFFLSFFFFFFFFLNHMPWCFLDGTGPYRVELSPEHQRRLSWGQPLFWQWPELRWCSYNRGVTLIKFGFIRY